MPPWRPPNLRQAAMWPSSWKRPAKTTRAMNSGDVLPAFELLHGGHRALEGQRLDGDEAGGRQDRQRPVEQLCQTGRQGAQARLADDLEVEQERVADAGRLGAGEKAGREPPVEQRRQGLLVHLEAADAFEGRLERGQVGRLLAEGDQQVAHLDADHEVRLLDLDEELLLTGAAILERQDAQLGVEAGDRRLRGGAGGGRQGGGSGWIHRGRLSRKGVPGNAAPSRRGRLRVTAERRFGCCDWGAATALLRPGCCY